MHGVSARHGAWKEEQLLCDVNETLFALLDSVETGRYITSLSQIRCVRDLPFRGCLVAADAEDALAERVERHVSPRNQTSLMPKSLQLTGKRLLPKAKAAGS